MDNEEVAGMVIKLAMEDGSFQDSINNLNRQMKVVDSEFKSATCGARDFGNSIDGLKANVEKLNQTSALQNNLIDLYQKRLDSSRATLEKNVQAQSKLTKELENAKNAYKESKDSIGESADETQALKKELDKLEEAYKKNNERIRNSVKQIDNHTVSLNNAKAKLGQMEAQLKEATQAMDNFGKETDKATDKVVSGVDIMNVSIGNLLADGVKGLLDGIGEMVEYAIEWSAEVDKMAAQTGFAIDEVQKWDAVLKSTGADIDTLAGSLADFQERIFDASEGAGEAYEVFSDLGVSVTNVDGSLRSTQAVFNESILALQNMTDETKKNAYATILLSTAGEDLAQVLGMTNEELLKAKGNANIVSEADINAINDFKAAFVEFIEGAGKPLIGILGDLATLLTPLVELATMVVNPILNVIEGVTSTLADCFRETSEMEEEYLRDNAGNVEEVYKNAEGAVSDSLNAIQEDTENTFSYLDKAVDNYVNDKLKRYEEKLRESYNTGSLHEEMKIQRLLEKEKQKLEERAKYQSEKEKQSYSGRENAYKQHLQNMNSIYKNTASKDVRSSSLSMPKIEEYHKGTKYHPGGMAIVGEKGPEFINLPRGSQVMTNGQTQQVMNTSNTTNQGTTYNLNNVTIQTNNAQDLFNQIQILVRRGAFS